MRAPSQDPKMTDSAPKTARLLYGDKEIELPIITDTEGECAIDIGQLRAQSGLIT